MEKLLKILRKCLRFSPMVIIFILGIYGITRGWASWNDIKPTVNEVINYKYRTEIIWFVNLFIGYFYYYHIGRKKKESRHTIVQTSFPILDAILTVVTYGTVINSTFYLLSEVVNGDLIKISFDWVSLFIAVFIILFWCLKRLYEMVNDIFITILSKSNDDLLIGSSNIGSISYDNSSKSLTIEFKNSNYKYLNVPQEVSDDFNKSESKGKFFSENIKGKYQYEKLN